MKTVKTISEIRAVIKEWQRSGKTVGLVPTMGFLHEGHCSLITRSAAENDKTVVSIFVNPMQFSPGEDLEAYPRDMARDTDMCGKSGADIIFAPDPEEMYHGDFYSYVDMSVVTDGLCGRSRTNMFRGVCTVVSKLFNITTPDRAYFGKKDAQQLAVIGQMVKDLDFDIEIVGCDCVREADGLAKSSRNSYLSDGERAVAPKIYKALQQVKKLAQCGEYHSSVLTESFFRSMKDEPVFTTEYAEVVDGLTMQRVEQIKGDGTCIMAVAVKLGKARLIDNIEL
ncbi:MAG: pantoate--beta-alanine ligase [Eubacteriaceae bacterium]|nr:pantoate--beta-alanine ligase [Eubacteriaceae bacterium]